jgi:hypothetical protein
MTNVIDVARNTCEAADIIGSRYELIETEIEMLHMLATGHRVATMAEALYLARGTIRNRLSFMYVKVGVQTQTELMILLHRTAAELTQNPA